MMNFVVELEEQFKRNKNDEKALKMSKYMKNKFPFAGIQSQDLKNIYKPLVQQYKTKDFEEMKNISQLLWEKEEREYQYVAMDYLSVNKFYQFENSIEVLEQLILNKSWWDTVDMLASNLVGSYFIKFPEHQAHYFEKWICHESFWLRRTALIFQLKYKEKTNTELLTKAILACKDEKEFFIRKAIGWALRQYSYFNAEFVIHFVQNHDLSTLSQREALKALQRKMKNSII